MSDNIPCVKTIDDWDSFQEYIRDVELYKPSEFDTPYYLPIISDWKENGKIFYRGHSNVKYKLQSTLERYITDKDKNNINLSKDDFNQIQNNFLIVCKRLLRGRISEQFILVDDKFENEVWAVGQHFGLRTPLLDWSKSFWVALFFAFEELHSGSEYRVIYILNRFLADKEFPIIESKVDIGGRMFAQKGVFTNLLSSEMEQRNQECKSKYENTVMEGRDPPITKIYISSKLRNNVLEFLHSININASTLFPDIQGAIKDCHIELEGVITGHFLE